MAASVSTMPAVRQRGTPPLRQPRTMPGTSSASKSGCCQAENRSRFCSIVSGPDTLKSRSIPATRSMKNEAPTGWSAGAGMPWLVSSNCQYTIQNTPMAA